jgi:hypothetical protein
VLPANFLGIQIDGPSREGFYFAPAFRGSAGENGKIGTGAPHIYPNGAVHDWKLAFTPAHDTRPAALELSLDGRGSKLELPRDRSGLIFDRFGIITTWIDGNGQSVYFDDLTFTCQQP